MYQEKLCLGKDLVSYYTNQYQIVRLISNNIVLNVHFSVPEVWHGTNMIYQEYTHTCSRQIFYAVILQSRNKSFKKQ